MEHCIDAVADFIHRFDDAHSTLVIVVALEPSGAAAACMNLRLDHPDRTSEIFGNLRGLISGVGYPAFRHGDTVFSE